MDVLSKTISFGGLGAHSGCSVWEGRRAIFFPFFFVGRPVGPGNKNGQTKTMFKKRMVANTNGNNNLKNNIFFSN